MHKDDWLFEVARSGHKGTEGHVTPALPLGEQVTLCMSGMHYSILVGPYDFLILNWLWSNFIIR